LCFFIKQKIETWSLVLVSDLGQSVIKLF